MRVAIMQPYLLPYLGYFQLIGAADQFVIYDNIKYTKQGWINRNRISLDGREVVFTLPLQRAPDATEISGRHIAESFDPIKMLNKFHGAYAQTPFFDATFPLLENIFEFQSSNLFEFISHSIIATLEHLKMPINIVAASAISANHGLKGQDRVISICKALRATQYINPIGGLELYSRDEFKQNGIELKFLRSVPLEYRQKNNPFLPNLSIADVLMFNPRDTVVNSIANHFEYV